ncbi:unnamed protein product [Rodentolepis nana]|uniref:Uncharacterized protein n=1 Tax=Rodentolepis nana TaxID=102285 RepID=A0A0R3TZH6_RODNA|nr:unnamed protein product [Rodentolepis nana]
MEPRLGISVEESSPTINKSNCLARQQNDNECFLPPLPSIEQMRMDVANATSELQQAFFQNQKHNLDPEVEWHKGGENALDDLKKNQLERIDDSRPRTQEETVCEELIINGKKYRHTFQKRVVLESQKTREIFILPASSDSTRPIENSPLKDNYASSNFDRYHRAFEENGARLDLQVHNQEGDFSPMLVVAPHGESPDGPRSPSIGMCRSSESKEQSCQDSVSPTLSREETGNSCDNPLGKITL